MDWSALLSFDTSPLELVVRGTLMYWLLLLVFRFILRRDMGALAVPDVLFIVIVADASQNGLSGSYQSVAEACVLVGTLVFWNYLLDFASFHVEAVRRLMEPKPLPLIRHGRVLARNLRQEFLTQDDLDAQLRQAGVSSVAEVREAYMESDGRFSVLTYRRGARRPAESQLPVFLASPCCSSYITGIVLPVTGSIGAE
jgi:uncharacterized membrane protein YcaP (DUF421 family)